MDILKELELGDLAESAQVEIKKATGRDGSGEVPRDFFPSYSAFANTNGGYIFLGMAQHGPKDYSVIGIHQAERVLKDLWDNLNNRQKVNVNILAEKNVKVLKVGGRNIIRVQVPRASRSQRPVYVGQNPLTGTYRRNYEGDYLCDSDTVKRMLADQTEDTRDGKIIENSQISDLDLESLKAYRKHFAFIKTESPWLELDDSEFLSRIGGYARDRNSGVSGLTVAGLLMFGRSETIAENLPSVFLDYQEKSDGPDAVRWIDRITPDDSWSGNLYDFYRKVSIKLTQDLKKPFQLRGGIRVDETSIHEALREALINTIIHADYAGTLAMRIVKKANTFEFRNPGTMRVSRDEAIHGGVSDCRNRNLQKMFRLIGIGEHAGSGLPQIYKIWDKQQWIAPSLIERNEPPDSTTLILQMASIQRDLVDGGTELIVPGTVLWKKAMSIGKEARVKARIPRQKLEEIISSITSLGYINAEDLARLLGREKTSVQNHYLTRMVKDGRLVLKFPQNPNAINQSYCSPKNRSSAK